MNFGKEVQYLEDRRMQLLKEIRTRNEKIKALEIELKVYYKLKSVENLQGVENGRSQDRS